MYKYAQIDDSGIAIAVSMLSGPVNAANLIPLSSDENVVGMCWTGTVWEARPQPEPAPEHRHISVGAFFDRFGAAKYAILADTAPAVQALIKDASVRQYIDLNRADLPAGLQMLVDAGHAIDPAAILSAPIEPGERP